MQDVYTAPGTKFMVFAPKESAFVAAASLGLPPANLLASPKLCRELLQYHIVKGSVKTSAMFEVRHGGPARQLRCGQREPEAARNLVYAAASIIAQGAHITRLCQALIWAKPSIASKTGQTIIGWVGCRCCVSQRQQTWPPTHV